MARDGKHGADVIKETNNYQGGRSGSKCTVKSGPVEGRIKKNPLKGGGINRAPKG